MAGYKILIVEDDETIADMEKEHLQKWDYTVHCVKNFRQIVSDVAEFKPDLILMDVKPKSANFQKSLLYLFPQRMMI